MKQTTIILALSIILAALIARQAMRGPRTQQTQKRIKGFSVSGSGEPST